MNQPSRIAAGIAVFCGGVLLGFFLRRDSSARGNPPAMEAVRPQAPPGSSARSDSPVPAPELARLETRIRELEAELKAIRGADVKPGSELTRASLEELFKDYLELNQDRNRDPEKARILFGRLSQLDEKSAGYFIDLFRKSVKEDSDEREIALELALLCGGATTADFVNLLLNDASLDNPTRQILLAELSGTNGSLFSVRRLPIGDPLGSTAMTLCRSSKPEDRQGGAGLLGGLKTEASRIELRRLVDEDKDASVRTSAIVSLGHVGDPSTRSYLERLWTAPETARMSGQAVAKFRNALESALKELADGSR